MTDQFNPEPSADTETPGRLSCGGFIVHINYNKEHLQRQWQITRRERRFSKLQHGEGILRRKKQGMRQGFQGRCVSKSLFVSTWDT